MPYSNGIIYQGYPQKPVCVASDGEIAIKIFMDPPSATSQQKRACRTSFGIRFFDPPNVTQARRNYNNALRAAIRGVKLPANLPFNGPVSVSILFAFAYPTGTAIKHRMDLAYKITRPDCDNSAKLLIDTITPLGFWHDDAQIAHLTVEKRYTVTTPFINVVIRDLSRLLELAK